MENMETYGEIKNDQEIERCSDVEIERERKKKKKQCVYIMYIIHSYIYIYIYIRRKIGRHEYGLMEKWNLWVNG